MSLSRYTGVSERSCDELSAVVALGLSKGFQEVGSESELGPCAVVNVQG